MSANTRWITVILSLGLLTQFVQGYLNIFIDQKEMVKLMDLDAELFYVRHGIVNNFALSFVVPVPEQVDDLTFSWQSLVDLPIRYSISIEYESQLGGLQTPHINVPVHGLVPIEPSTFTIRLPCTGNVSEEVPVGIHLEIDGYPHFNRTKLTFKRNKICVRDETLFETNMKAESVVFKLIVFAFTFLLVSSVVLVTCYCRGTLRERHPSKIHDVSPQTSYTIEDSSSCSASSQGTMTTMAKSTTGRHNPHHSHHHHLSHFQHLQRPQLHSAGLLHYDNVQQQHRAQSIAAQSCSSLYETIVESVNKFPMQTMHSNKTCGACCSVFGGDQAVYDGVTIAGLLLPPQLPHHNNKSSRMDSMDRRSMATTTTETTAIYELPEEATIRWPAPPLFTIEDEQQRAKKQQNPQHCYAANKGPVSSHHTLKPETSTRTATTAPGTQTMSGRMGGTGLGLSSGFESNPFRSGLWNADAAATEDEAANKETCTYYEPTTFVNQHL